MSDRDIWYLQNCLNAGLIVWWMDPKQGWRMVRHIAPLGGEGMCMFFEGGGYGVLENMTRDEIMVTTGNIAQWMGEG